MVKLFTRESVTTAHPCHNHNCSTKPQSLPTGNLQHAPAQAKNRAAAPKNANGSRAADSGDELDQRILGMEKVVGAGFHRNILREYGRVNQPKLICDVAIKQKVLEMLESVARGIGRLEDVLKRTNPNTVQALLAKLQAPPWAGLRT